MTRSIFPVAALALLAACGTQNEQDLGAQQLSAQEAAPAVDVTPAVHRDVSPPLRDIPVSPSARRLTERPLRPIPGSPSQGGADPVVQAAAAPAPIASFLLNIPGVGNGDYGFRPDAAPPDTVGAIGATQYVQWVNESFAVFDRSGTRVYGPVPGNTLWKGFGGGCETNNDGDPIVQWDKAARRWVMTQFSVSTRPYLQCVAVSQTEDATGAWYRYAFSYGTDFNDYPKLGVWPDAYYVTYNVFANGSTFKGSKLCAWDRASMLAGQAATQQCFQLSTSYGGVLPADVDGPAAPPAGAPNYLLAIATNSLNLWKFHVDWSTPANTTLTSPTNIAVATYSRACNGGACIPQPGTSQQLDSLGDRLMYRLAYRNLNGVEHLVANHAVTASGTTKRSTVIGVRWYDLRATSPGAFSVYQQGTFSPDSVHRWMASAAMDKLGNIAVGYSASSGSVYPSVRVAYRSATDTLGILGGETVVQAGGGSQLRNLSRWGDYSAMTVDPTDDCTFWFTSEYLKASGTFNWSTKIASFKIPGCQ